MAGRHRVRAGMARTLLTVAVPIVGAAAVATAVVLGSATVSAQPSTVAIPTFPSQERVLATNVVAVSSAPFAVHRSSGMAGEAVSDASTAVDRRLDEQRAAAARADAAARAAARADAAAKADAAASRSAEAAARAADRAEETSEAPASPPARVAPRPTTAPRPPATTAPRSTPAPSTTPDDRARSAAPEPTEDAAPADDADEPGAPIGGDLLDGGLLGGTSLLGG